jgi:hypothetical protein
MMKQGFYGGGTVGFLPLPVGTLGGGAYIDSNGNLYPQIYYGTPKASFSGGYTPDLEGLLTGLSVSGTIAHGINPNLSTSGAPVGVGIGTPGAGITYGFGPIPLKKAFDFQPRMDEFGQPFPGSETPAPGPANNFPGQGMTPDNVNPVLKFLDSFRPRTDELGNPFPGPQSLAGVLKYGEGSPSISPDLAQLSPDPIADPDSATDVGANDFRRLGAASSSLFDTSGKSPA